MSTTSALWPAPAAGGPAAPVSAEPAPATGAGAAPSSLRSTALRSGAYMTVRETLGALVRLAGLVVVMRQIGPASFGIYSAAAAYVQFPTVLAQMGAEVFVVRQPGPLARRTYDEVFTFLLAASGIVVAASFGLSFLVAPWLDPIGVLAPLRVLLFAIPINILWAPYQACIERKFAYRRMGLLELGGDVVLYATAVPMALLGYGAWSLVAGFFAWQAWLLAGAVVLSGVRPRLAWSNRTARALVAHGRTYNLTSWISGARTSIITLIVASFAGATGVGLMSFAARLIATMNFTTRGVHRVGMVAISRAGTDRPDRMAAALEEGTLLLLVVSALPLVAFGLCAHWVVPDVFGRAWVSAIPLYVLFALVVILRVPSYVQRTLLYARGVNMAPATTAAIELVIVSVVSLVAVRELGIVGVGIASLAAVISVVNTVCAARRLVAVRYRRLIVPLVGLVPPVFVPLAPLPWSLLLLLPSVLLVVNPTTRRELAALMATGRSMLARRQRRSPRTQVVADVTTNRAAPSFQGPMASGQQPHPYAYPSAGWSPVAPAATSSRGTDVPAEALPWNGVGVPGGLDGLAALLDACDPATGLPSAAVLLARAGRILGSASEPGWTLGLVALRLERTRGSLPLEVPSEQILCTAAHALLAELRFDDLVARVDPFTFVVAALLVDCDAEGPALAPHLEAAVRTAVAPAWTVHAADIRAPLPCDGQADLLVRQVVEAGRG